MIAVFVFCYMFVILENVLVKVVDLDEIVCHVDV
jgi:hypothetical protein